MSCQSFKVDEKTFLRPLCINDAQASFDLVCKNKKSLGKWLPWVNGLKTVDDEVDYITNATKYIEQGIKFELGIFTKLNFQNINDDLANWKLIGTCGFVEIKSNCGWIGYWLDEDYRGKGVISKACQTLIKDVAKFLNLNELKMHIVPENAASLAVAERAGFVTNGKLIKSDIYGSGKLYDVYVFELKVL